LYEDSDGTFRGSSGVDTRIATRIGATEACPDASPVAPRDGISRNPRKSLCSMNFNHIQAAAHGDAKDLPLCFLVF